MSNREVADRQPAFSLEALEPRITPANFFLSPDGNVTDKSGQDVNIESLATNVGVAKAILLKKGDRLLYDFDGDHSRDSNDWNLFKVKGGGAYVFLDDIVPNDTFSLEISGVAATTKFSAFAGTHIHGDVATMATVQGSGKNAVYEFTQAIVPGATIVGLSAHGGVGGSILAGGDISNIYTSNNGNYFTVKDIRAGTAAGDRSVDFGGEISIEVPAVVATSGAKGASISSLLIKGGAENIVAGDGGAITDPSSKLKPGEGGSVTGVTFFGTYFPNDRSNYSSGGVIDIGGGSGGTIGVGTIGVVGILAAPTQDKTVITAGSAGAGGEASGGSIGKIALKNIEFKNLILNTGDGSDSELEGKSGGDGGAFSGFKTFETTLKSLTITTGDGGNAAPGGDGGNGGKIRVISIASHKPDITLRTGDGGTGVHGGHGGDFATSTLRSTWDLASIAFTSGNGGDGTESGGDSGQIKRPFNLLPRVDIDNITLTSGDGGNASSGPGGKAGALPRLESISAASIEAHPGMDGASTHELEKPRNFFLTPDGGVVDASGKDVNLASLASGVGTARAILLVKGDRLIFDADGDRSFDEGTETNLFQVEAGGSYVFLNDIISGDASPLDISGVAVSTGFIGSAQADVLGDIATMLTVQGKGVKAVYQFETAITPGATIEGFSSSGIVSGSILAGGDISRITISGETDGFSVRDIRAGTGIGEFEADFGGSTPIEFAPVFAAPGTRGASISFVTLAGGANFIAAGDGASQPDAAAPQGTPGGSVRDLSAAIHHDITIIAGNAGNGTGGSLKGITLTGFNAESDIALVGGNGASGVKPHAGSITDVALLGTALGDVVLTAGNGASSATGGIGGSISHLTAATASFGSLSLNTGSGGDALPPADTFTSKTVNGGDAGSFSAITISGNVPTLTITGGNGGDGATSYKPYSAGADSRGGAGTTIDGDEFAITGNLETLIVTGGAGGSAVLAGKGGAITDWTFESSIKDIRLTSGSAGSGGISLKYNALASVISNIHFASGTFENVSITGAKGSEGILLSMADPEITFWGRQGGYGGYINGVSSDGAAVIGQLMLIGGDGGDGGSEQISETLVSVSGGGSGGQVSDIHLAGYVGTLVAAGGKGGQGQITTGTDGTQYSWAGSGGSVSNVSADHVDTLSIRGGNGEDSISGNGGSGGGIYNITASISERADIFAGNGGASIPSKYAEYGGARGNVSLVSISSFSTERVNVSIHAGDEGLGYQHYYFLSQYPAVSGVTLSDGNFGIVDIRGGRGGDSPANLAGTSSGFAGAGGNLSKITVAEDASIDLLNLLAGDGGDSAYLPGGTGGNGGMIDGNSSVFAGEINHLTMRGGDGGTGYERSGNGGSIESGLITVTGSIENLTMVAGDAGASEAPASLQPVTYGGSGGSIYGGTFFVNGNAVIFAGDGASSAMGGGGGGGDVSQLTVHGTNSDATVSISAGAGGSGYQYAQEGGNISQVSILGTLSRLKILAGDGGSRPSFGYGESGGTVTYLVLNAAIHEATIASGDGGQGDNGGHGGHFDSGEIQIKANLDIINLISGNGGDGQQSGGSGGTVNKPFLFSPGVELIAAIVTSGNGGDGHSEFGRGGQISGISPFDGLEIHPGGNGKILV